MRDVDADIDQIVKPCRADESDIKAPHDEQHSEAMLNLLLLKSEMAQPFRSRAFQEIEVSAVVNNFAGIGVLKIHAYRN